MAVIQWIIVACQSTTRCCHKNTSLRGDQLNFTRVMAPETKPSNDDLLHTLMLNCLKVAMLLLFANQNRRWQRHFNVLVTGKGVIATE